MLVSTHGAPVGVSAVLRLMMDFSQRTYETLPRGPHVGTAFRILFDGQTVERKPAREDLGDWFYGRSLGNGFGAHLRPFIAGA
jgi:hypothetical protein